MRGTLSATSIRKLFLGIIFSVFTVGGMPAYAENCDSSVVVTSPTQNSSLTDSSVDITGNTKNVTQLDVYVDGKYSASEALAPNTTVYSVAISLSSGDHTLQITATDTCGQTIQSDAVKVTFDGSSINTATDTKTGGGVVVDQSSGDASSAPKDSTQDSSKQSSNGFMQAVANMTDLNALGKRSTAWTIIHALLLIAGLVLLVFGPASYTWLRSRLAGRPVNATLFSHIIERVVGLAMIVVAFII